MAKRSGSSLLRSTSSLLGRRLLFVTGKGGVGKTTVTAALALALERAGMRVLVAVCADANGMARLLGSAPFDETLAQLRENLYAVHLVPDRAFAEYARLVLGDRSLTRKAFESDWVLRFLEGVPGLSEWAMLGKAWYHTTETRDDGKPRFDVVLFDAPATGHGLEMLRVPGVILRAAPTGRLRDDASQAWQMLSDPARAGIVVVALAEELPATETLELYRELTLKLNLRVAELVVNVCVEPIFDPEERALLAGLPVHPPTGPADEVLELAAYRSARESAQTENLGRLEAIDAPRLELPALVSELDTHAMALRLSHAFDVALGGKP